MAIVLDNSGGFQQPTPLQNDALSGDSSYRRQVTNQFHPNLFLHISQYPLMSKVLCKQRLKNVIQSLSLEYENSFDYDSQEGEELTKLVKSISHFKGLKKITLKISNFEILNTKILFNAVRKLKLLDKVVTFQQNQSQEFANFPRFTSQRITRIIQLKELCYSYKSYSYSEQIQLKDYLKIGQMIKSNNQIQKLNLIIENCISQYSKQYPFILQKISELQNLKCCKVNFLDCVSLGRINSFKELFLSSDRVYKMVKTIKYFSFRVREDRRCDREMEFTFISKKENENDENNFSIILKNCKLLEDSSQKDAEQLPYSFCVPTDKGFRERVKAFEFFFEESDSNSPQLAIQVAFPNLTSLIFKSLYHETYNPGITLPHSSYFCVRDIGTLKYLQELELYFDSAICDGDISRLNVSLTELVNLKKLHQFINGNLCTISSQNLALLFENICSMKKLVSLDLNLYKIGLDISVIKILEKIGDKNNLLEKFNLIIACIGGQYGEQDQSWTVNLEKCLRSKNIKELKIDIRIPKQY